MLWLGAFRQIDTVLHFIQRNERNSGRPKITSDEEKVVLAKKVHKDHTLEIDDICKTLRISRSTFYRYIRL